MAHTHTHTHRRLCSRWYCSSALTYCHWMEFSMSSTTRSVYLHSSARQRVASHGIIPMVGTQFKAFCWCRTRHWDSKCKWRSKMINPLKSFLASNPRKDYSCKSDALPTLSLVFTVKVVKVICHPPTQIDDQLLNHRTCFFCCGKNALQELRGRFSFVDVLVNLHMHLSMGAVVIPTILHKQHTSTRAALS